MVHVVIYYEKSEIYKVQLNFKINYNTYLFIDVIKHINCLLC
jgi:hypothetical protein